MERAPAAPTLEPMTPIIPEHEGVWVPCGTCWGQRRLYAVAAGTGDLVPHACPSCMGVGERLVGGDHAPAVTP